MFDRRGDQIEVGDYVLFAAPDEEEGADTRAKLDEGEIIAFPQVENGLTILHVVPADGYVRRVWPRDAVLSIAGRQ